jgi:hypothetical protein
VELGGARWSKVELGGAWWGLEKLARTRISSVGLDGTRWD